MSNPAIFLDRDGVLIENRPEYVRSWQEVVLLPGVLPALARLSPTRYRIVLVTNQAGIGRGLISPARAAEINQRLVELVTSAGGRIDAVYTCPHRADEGCNCRKPMPGLLLQAAQDLSIDLSCSVMIGDNLTDIMAGLAAGLAKVALVRTGLGAEQESRSVRADLPPFPVYETLAEALSALIPNEAS